MTVLHMDCREGMAMFPDNTFDSIVTDPPYELGFMGKSWDASGIAYSIEVWREALRVLKPGGHLLAFSGSRTYHRMACAIEDAGFDIRDQIMWVYASGMPKSFNMKREAGKSICGCCAGTLPYTHENTEPKTECDVRPVRNANVPAPESVGQERGQVLQPRVSQQGAPAHLEAGHVAGHAGREQSRVEGRGDAVQAQGQLQGHSVHSGFGEITTDGAGGRLHHGTPGRNGGMVRLSADADGSGAPRRSRSDEQPALQSGTVADEQLAQTLGAWPLCTGCGLPMVPPGLGTALKPAHEPICVARKPLIGTVAANVLAHGTGALNIDGCRVPGAKPDTTRGASSKASSMVGTLGAQGRIVDDGMGRWPANLIHDGSPEVLAAFPHAVGQQGALTGDEPSARAGAVDQNCYGTMDRRHASEPRDELDKSAARFFYCAKASKKDRGEDNTHPTVKPTDLMRYLLRLVTPPGGLALDPFAGSGSTFKAARLEGFDFIGFELQAEYVAIANAR